MTGRLHSLSLARLAAGNRGAVLTEFALILPVMAMLLLGALDAGHHLYMQATLQGAVQKASRDSGLESGLSTASQTAIDNKIKAQVSALVKSANIQITRKAYLSFTSASANLESYTDTNSNGTCDNNEPYNDENASGTRDSGARTGGGSAKDSVLLTVTATYPRLFPLSGMIGLPANVTISASTLMNNQPFGDQNVAVVGHCTP